MSKKHRDLAEAIASAQQTVTFMGKTFDVLPPRVIDIEEYQRHFGFAADAAEQQSPMQNLNDRIVVFWVLIRRSGLTADQVKQKQWAISLDELRNGLDLDSATIMARVVNDFFNDRRAATTTETSSPSAPGPASLTSAPDDARVVEASVLTGGQSSSS